MMTRRDVLKAAALAACAPGLSAWTREEKIRLGVASYSLRKFKRAQTIEMVKACGTPYVNIKSVHLPYTLSPEELAAGRKEFDDAGLQVVGSGNNSLASEKDIATLFEYAKAARFPLLVIYCAVRGLLAGGRGLWERYDNGDNLLFREADLRSPRGSALVWELVRLNDPELRLLVDALSRGAADSS